MNGYNCHNRIPITTSAILMLACVGPAVAMAASAPSGSQTATANSSSAQAQVPKNLPAPPPPYQKEMSQIYAAAKAQTSLPGGSEGAMLDQVGQGKLTAQTALSAIQKAHLPSQTAGMLSAAVTALQSPGAASATALESALANAPQGAPAQVYEVLGAALRQAQPGVPVHVVVNGQQVHFASLGLEPYISGGSTLIPLRAVSTALGGQVAWSTKTGTATLSWTSTPNGPVTLALKPGSTVMWQTTSKGKVGVLMDTTAQDQNGRLAIPIRYVAQAIGDQVGWYGGSAGLVTIATPVGG